MLLSKITDPTYVARRLGVFDVVPNALGRATGAFSLARSTLTQEPAPVAPSPFEVVCGIGCSRLVRYLPRTERRYAEPVVLVPSLINRPYILDIMDGISVVQALLDAGFVVYLTDWGEPTDADIHAGFDEYVGNRLKSFVKAACADAGVEKAHLMGQCLGGTMTTALAAVDDANIKSMVNLTAPISFEDHGMLSAWSRAPFFDAAAFAETFGNIPAWITQPSFVILRPLGQPSKIIRLFQNLGSEKFLSFFRCLETWINDNVAIPKAFYVDLITKLYREDALVNGGLRVNDTQVILENVEVPVLTIAASDDHIVPVESAYAGNDRFSSEDKDAVTILGGHIGVVVGGRGRRELWDRTTRFYADRSELVQGAVTAQGGEA